MKREQELITWLNEKDAKTLWSVAAFALQSWMNQRNCSEVFEVAQKIF